MKLFVDANTLVSGLVFEGNESLLLELGRLGVCALVCNDYVREEVRDVLSRPHLGLAHDEQVRALRILARYVTIVDDPPVADVRAAKDRLSDPKDVPVLLGFEGSGCDLLVTGDRRLRSEVPKAVTSRAALRLLLGMIGP